MSRPKIYTDPRHATAVRFPIPVWERLVAESRDRGTSVTHLVERAVVAYLDNLPELSGPTPVTLSPEKLEALDRLSEQLITLSAALNRQRLGPVSPSDDEGTAV